jgi:hypothetical protein
MSEVETITAKQLVECVQRMLASLPSNGARLAFLRDCTEDVCCTLCGSTCVPCYCHPNYDI